MTYRTLIVGCGSMSRGWLKAINDQPDLAAEIDIVGLVDLDEDLARRLAEEFGLETVKIGSDLDSMLTDTKPDLVFDVVVPTARQQVVELALSHGCHVLSEKPMATNLHDAQSLIQSSKNAGKIHAIVQNRRFVDGAERVRRYIESGALGTLSSLHCDFFLGPHFGGFREEMDHVLLLDMAIHTFDAARFMSGQEPEAVYCHETNPAGSWYQSGAAANAIFELSNQVVFTYRGSWCADGFRTSWESEWRLTGTKGTLVWDGANELSAEIVSGDGGFFSDVKASAVPAIEDGGLVEGHAGVIRDFVSAIAEKRAPLTANNDNIKSLAMVFNAIESAKTGQRITF